FSTVAGLENPNIPQSTSNIATLPGMPGTGTPAAAQEASSDQQLQAILNKQNQQMAEQKYQQQIQQRTSDMLSAANQSLQEWRKVSTQVYTAGTAKEEQVTTTNTVVNSTTINNNTLDGERITNQQGPTIKTGDVVFAVMDTSVNSDEPGPILATVVSGRLKGSKLIGSFNLPSNANKMVITFNTMSIPGAPKTMSISAYAIDPNTARTALSSRTNHHYLMRYGSLFASSFLEGFGNAFQSADTTVTIGGTGGGNNITVQNGIGRSTLENAVIGLATLGKSWGQQAQQLFNTPTTVEVYSGTGIGVLFTQDVTIT
ncbi:MAG: TrbI/VirB10 family protein, partial [Legionella sp.]|nr:TrbI/VirB10 family protein [Legionella sp.]